MPSTKRVSIDTTDKAFDFIQRFRDRTDTLLRGVQIILGEGENAVQIRFNERELTAAAIETAIRGIRAALGDEQAAVQVIIKGGITFGDGFALKEFAEVAGIELKSGDVIQDADRSTGQRRKTTPRRCPRPPDEAAPSTPTAPWALASLRPPTRITSWSRSRAATPRRC